MKPCALSKIQPVLKLGFRVAALCVFALDPAAFAASQAAPADCSTAGFPAGAVHGELAGKPFAPKTVTLQKSGSMATGGKKFDTWTLHFEQPEGDVSFGLSADVQFLLPAGESPAGHALRSVPGGIDRQPAVVKGLPEVQGWEFSDFDADVDVDSDDVEGSSLRVEFGKAAGKTMPGRIYLCAPVDKKTWLGGSFTADTSQ